MDNLELQKHANDVRKGIITSVHSARAGHPGGSLSAADVFTFLYFEEMNVDPAHPEMDGRDRFVLSKGHAAPGLYAALAHRGFFPVEDLLTLRKLGSYLQGHPCLGIPGVDMATGSLGQGISAACGMALAAKLRKMDYRVYTLLGDGEIEEGQVCSPFPIDKKFEAFNFHVTHADAHDFDSLRKAFQEARATKGMPTCIVMHSLKGKGVSFMENVAGWHGKAPGDEEFAVAMADLDKIEKELAQRSEKEGEA